MKKDVVSKVWQLIFLLALSIPMSGFAQAIQVKGTVLKCYQQECGLPARNNQ